MLLSSQMCSLKIWSFPHASGPDHNGVSRGTEWVCAVIVVARV